MSLDATTLRETAARHGFAVAGVASAAPLADDLERLEAYCAAGHAAGMEWLSRRPPERADPRTLLRSVRSVVTLAVDYAASAPAFVAESRYGRVARYAWGRDYHDVVRPRLRALARDLSDALGGCATACAVDHSPILERALAARAGLGFVGKNTCLIRPRGGSWTFLAEVLLAADLPATAPETGGGCGTCRACLDACPTDAFVDAWRLDARRCVSYLTIEHRGPVPRSLRAAMGAWVFGCDGCQDPCPYGRFAPETAWPELRPEAGVGPRLDLVATLSIADDDEFARRFAGTPLTRPRRAGLLRNAAIAARNVGAEAAVPALASRVEGDPSPLVRGHALWALEGLAPDRARALADAARSDDDAAVREEAGAVLAGAG